VGSYWEPGYHRRRDNGHAKKLEGRVKLLSGREMIAERVEGG